MQVRIVETRCHRAATSIDDVRCVSNQRGDIVALADADKMTVAHGESRGTWALQVDRDDMRVQHDQVGRQVVGAMSRSAAKRRTDAGH